MHNLQNINGIKDILIKNHETLAVAESVTSGHLQAEFSLAKDATHFYQGGITAYNLDQKTRLLHIDPVHAMTCNSVSEKIAEDLAKNVSKLFSSDWGVGVTGYAAPIPESGITELFAFFAIAHKGEIVLSKKMKGLKNEPSKVQLHYAHELLREFFHFLRNSNQ